LKKAYFGAFSFAIIGSMWSSYSNSLVQVSKFWCLARGWDCQTSKSQTWQDFFAPLKFSSSKLNQALEILGCKNSLVSWNPWTSALHWRHVSLKKFNLLTWSNC